MSTWFVRDGRLLATTIALLVVAGLSAFVTIVKQEDPTITNGVAIIVAPFPGASAERVEALITDEIEEELREIAEIKTISSVSRNGVAVVAVELDDNLQGDETAPAFAKIRDALDDAHARFPRGAPPPQFDDQRFGAYTRIVALRWELDKPPARGILERFGDELADRMRDVNGTKVVRVFGAPAQEIVVATSAERLGAVGLTPDALAQAIRLADAKVSAGVLRTGEGNVTIEVSGELDSLDRIRSIPLDGTSGALLRVGDVADVRREVESPMRDLAFADGTPAVLVAAQLAPGMAFDTWSERLDAQLAGYEQALPTGLALQPVFDQSGYTRARLGDLVGNLVVGLIIVVLVLFVTLGWRSALVVGATLPLVSFASLSVLRYLEVPIHQMSITGLIVALGLLVDNAIVVVDAVRHRRLEGLDPVASVRGAIAHLWLPLLSSTITTVLAFMPILLLSGRVGEFVGTLGLSVIIAIVSSYVVAMTVVAALAGRFVRPVRHDNASWLRRCLSEGISIPALTRAFDRTVAWSLRHPKTSMALALVVPLMGFAGATQLPKQFFPPADRDQFHVELRMPPSSSIEDTTRATRRVEAVLRERAEVVHVHWVVGRSAPPFYYNLKQDQDDTPSYAQAQVTVREAAEVEGLLPVLQRAVDAAVPEAQVLLRELLQGPPVDAPIEYRIYGADVGELRRLGDELRARMARVPSVTHTQATLSAGTPKIWVVADEEKARLAGLSLVEMARQLDTQLEGSVGGSVLEGSEELAVRVRLDAESRGDLVNIASTSLVSADPGRRARYAGVPLSALARLELRPELSGIPHRDGQRVNVVRGFIHAGVYPETAFSQLETVLTGEPMELPAGYRLETGGDAEKRGDAMGNLFAYVPVLMVLMIAVIALSLSSFRLAAVIFVVAFSSVGLGMFSLVVTGWPLGFNAMIGLIGLVGVAVNDAIVIASALRANPASVAGNADAIRRIVVGETSRHVVSTTVTTFGGFLPLILASGRFWPPFASAIAGGVLLATIVAFYFVPAAFLVITRRRPVELAEDDDLELPHAPILEAA
jgi:multidrug efflux pump